MKRTTKEIKRQAKMSLRGNLGTSLLTEVVADALTAIVCWIPFGSMVVRGPLGVGLSDVYCRNTDHEKPCFMDLFSGFRENLGENFLLGLVKGIFIFLWSLLLIVPGIVKAYGYSMAEYLMVRNRDLTAMEALRESQRLMKGNKMKLFGLELSFIGWNLLTIVTFGIAAIYVVPYMRTATTEFFNDIYYAE